MLQVRNVSKRYGSLRALEDVSATFEPGEIHAVLGENGAGKSTLMGVMAGFVSPNSGEVTLDGKPIPLGRAFDCKRMGIEMIHQHFTLVPDFTVEENLALSNLPSLLGAAKVTEAARPGLDAAERLGWPLSPKTRIRNLSVGQQQRLEILKALAGTASVLILDEPTAVLSPEEVVDLFRVLNGLKAEGRIVILIAHKLSEVMEVADRVTVLRRGRVVATAQRGDFDANRLAEWMVGEMPTPLTDTLQTATEPGLETKELWVKGDRNEDAVRGVSFEVRRGEVFGIGGVDGNGQLELAEAVAGIRPFEGEMVWDGSLGYIPQDRQIDGLALGLSVEENLLIGGYEKERLTKGPFLRLRQVHKWARELVDRFEIKTPSLKTSVASLSGGNQQKVVVSRTLDTDPELLVVVNPTRGLDIRASSFVHGKIREARNAGAAVLLVSTDLDELYALSDRRMFMSRGALVAEGGATSLVGGSS